MTPNPIPRAETIDPQHAEHLQRQQGEAGQQVELEVDQLPEAVLGFAGGPLSVAHRDLGDALGEAVGQGRDEAGALLALEQRVDDLAPVGPEHAPVVVQDDAGGPAGDRVDDLGGQGAEQAVVVHPALAPAAHHVEALLDLGDQLGDLLGRVLQVGVHGHDHLAAGHGEGAEDGRVLAVVAVEFHDADPGLAPGDVLEHGQAAVAAAVVGEDHLPGPAGILEIRIQDRRQALPEIGNIRFFVENGDHDAEEGGHANTPLEPF